MKMCAECRSRNFYKLSPVYIARATTNDAERCRCEQCMKIKLILPSECWVKYSQGVKRG